MTFMRSINLADPIKMETRTCHRAIGHFVLQWKPGYGGYGGYGGGGGVYGGPANYGVVGGSRGGVSSGTGVSGGSAGGVASGEQGGGGYMSDASSQGGAQGSGVPQANGPPISRVGYGGYGAQTMQAQEH
ncbi:glycine-rich RNA-binding protein 3, mitochondrial-like [Amborella trichopoda]|uniref:glycine-rich RNA-binding protein 3, mitochondrial-like n=1 Tax=Amborella trichopoda TaxID=13333 RepID=UPI0005D34D64|nr:glycine-rich RNA-binding protein 3, mitochondrial-like [Amborella trichopoda]|eukprot:XP_011623193.1 glycine-rich RNA-binding protein 3, mitochondrial-like [Amborella trichopoda]